MNQQTIKETSRLLGLPPSTIRYWEKSGLLELKRNEENDYRNFCYEDLLTLLDIQLCRDLDISIKDLRQREEWKLQDWQNIYKDKLEETQAKIKELEALQAKQRRKQALADQLLAIGEDLLEIEECSFDYPYLLRDDTRNPDVFSRYVEDESLHGFVINPQDSRNLDYGLFSHSVSDDLIWRAQDLKGKLFTAVYWQQRKGDQSNLENLLSQLKSKGLKAQTIVGRYMLSAADQGFFADYYQVWIEAKE